MPNNGVGVSDNKEDYLENIEEKLSVQDIKISVNQSITTRNNSNTINK